MKLTRGQRARIEAARENHEHTVNEACEAVGRYNENVAEKREALEKALDEYNSALAEEWSQLQSHADSVSESARNLAEAVQEVGSELRGDWDNKSEKWQDSDAGRSADEWVQTFEEFELDEWEPSEPEGVELEFSDPPDEPETADPFEELTEES